MADVIIKGMEMPNTCYLCRLRKRNGMEILCPVLGKSFSVADVNILHYRLNDCPISPAPEWISVEERGPDALRCVLAVCERKTASGRLRVVSSAHIDQVGCWHIHRPGLKQWIVTHWRPLPEPPEGGGSNG